MKTHSENVRLARLKMASRPTRTVNPTSRLIDPNNTETAVLSSHRQAVISAHAAAQQNTITPVITPPEITSTPSEHILQHDPAKTAAQPALPPSTSPPSSQQPRTSNKHAPSVELSFEEDKITIVESADGVPVAKPKKKKKWARKDTGKSDLIYLRRV